MSYGPLNSANHIFTRLKRLLTISDRGRIDGVCCPNQIKNHHFVICRALASYLSLNFIITNNHTELQSPRERRFCLLSWSTFLRNYLGLHQTRTHLVVCCGMWPWPVKLKIAYPVSDTTSVHCRSRPSIVVLSIVSFLLLLFLNIVYFSASAIIRWNAFCKFSLNILTTSTWCIMVPVLAVLLWVQPYFLFLYWANSIRDWVYFTYADFEIDICQFILKLIFRRI